jgi:hypothetical protein
MRSNIKRSNIKLCLLSVATVAMVAGSFAAGCNPTQKETAKSAIDEATAACQGETASAVVQRDKAGNIVQTFCTYEEEVAPFVENLIAARKTGAKYHPMPPANASNTAPVK